MTPGSVHVNASGFTTSNFDPDLNSTYNNEYYDANFIPGFQAGLTNLSVGWQSGQGYGDIQYKVGPWVQDEQGIPHLAVGPQCCNFVEVAHTQQFREPSWGDYYYVKAGFGPPGVNVQNYTADFKTPADVGLVTQSNWTVQSSLNWQQPSLMNRSNEWAAIGITATQYVANVPGNLVYTVIDFWMDQNSSSAMSMSSAGVPRLVTSPNVVTYHPLQLSAAGNQTLSFDLSAYLSDTLKALGIQPSQPPVISYVYLDIEGYNFAWNTTLWSFRVMSPTAVTSSPLEYGAVAVIAVASVLSLYLYKLRRRSGHSTPQEDHGRGSDPGHSNPD